MSKVLFHSLTIPPDNVSTGQLVADIAVELKLEGKQIEILAASPQYNFNNDIGELLNLYAVLEIQNLGKDFDYKIRDEEICLENTPSFINPVREIEMLETNNIRFQNKKSLDAFQFKFPSFTRWRMQTEKVTIDKNSWKSDLMFLTNDPFNKPQIVFESKDFSAEIFQAENFPAEHFSVE